jgi:hypothetical protein
MGGNGGPSKTHLAGPSIALAYVETAELQIINARMANAGPLHGLAARRARPMFLAAGSAALLGWNVSRKR